MPIAVGNDEAALYIDVIPRAEIADKPDLKMSRGVNKHFIARMCRTGSDKVRGDGGHLSRILRYIDLRHHRPGLIPVISKPRPGIELLSARYAQGGIGDRGYRDCAVRPLRHPGYRQRAAVGTAVVGQHVDADSGILRRLRRVGGGYRINGRIDGNGDLAGRRTGAITLGEAE